MLRSNEPLGDSCFMLSSEGLSAFKIDSRMRVGFVSDSCTSNAFFYSRNNCRRKPSDGIVCWMCIKVTTTRFFFQRLHSFAQSADLKAYTCLRTTCVDGIETAMVARLRHGLFRTPGIIGHWTPDAMFDKTRSSKFLPLVGDFPCCFRPRSL